jgi:hypothetical protein
VGYESDESPFNYYDQTKYMLPKKYSIYILISLCCIILSCSKMNDTYSGFIKDGEIVYTARVDSATTYPGNNRIALSMLLTSDPRISKVKVFWATSSSTDSAEKNVQRTSGVDTIRFAFDKLAEGTYTFDIYTYDDAGHKSVKTDVIGTVYGEKYLAQLVNRAIKSGTYDNTAKSAVIKWFGVGNDVIGEEIIYTDSTGGVKDLLQQHATLADTVTVLPVYKKGNTFQFRTLYKPAPNAIDTFYSSFETRSIP